MTHLEIIKTTYDKCKIIYVIKTNKEGWSYLFLTNIQDKAQMEATDLDFLCQYKQFIEFNKQGEIVSY